ncbi:DUF6362 family protein [Marinibaculum pumilum]|uniref:DUF6362 family protein n=1 Tax=Marinibaculum pumilum TaxID=1766165 RepID=A0ABV7KY79_9PROT
MTAPRPTTPAEVKALLIEALQTLAALPDPERRFLRQKGTGWPETLREAQEVFSNAVDAGGRFEAMRAPRSAPAPAAIDRMWLVLPWLHGVDSDDAWIFVARARGWHWQWIGDRLGITDRGAKKRADRVATTILEKVQGGSSQIRELVAFSLSSSRDARH